MDKSFDCSSPATIAFFKSKALYCMYEAKFRFAVKNEKNVVSDIMDYFIPPHTNLVRLTRMKQVVGNRQLRWPVV